MRRAITLSAAVALACALGASRASAGQIVWVQAAGSGGGALWAANDDGTYPHRLLAASGSAFSLAFPGATLGTPDLFQVGGASVLFTAASNTFAAPPPGCVSVFPVSCAVVGFNLAGCAEPCAASFSLTAGVLSRESSAVTTQSAAVFERQPRLSARGTMVDQYALYPAATPSALGAPAQTGLYTRPLDPSGAGTAGTPWSDTASETLAPSADPAPDPANPALLAWVAIADPSCTKFKLNRAAVCQYVIHVAGAGSTPAPPVAIFDDETPAGSGPSSLAWSSDGHKLLIVDDQAPNNGIYTVASSTAVTPAAKQITEVIAEPPGWTFGQARFAGKRIIFDARGSGRSTPTTSDIYSISAACDSGTCAFPADAKNLTAKASAENISPAWTSAAAPLLALGAPPLAGAPPVLDAATILSRTVSLKKGVSFEVTLSIAATLIVSISRGGHTIGTSTLHLPAGASTFTIKQAGGHPLTRGADKGKLRLQGAAANAVAYSASFNVR